MYISIGKTATLLGVSVSTLRRWDKSKKLPATLVTKGKHRRYDLKIITQKVKGEEKENNEESSFNNVKNKSEQLPVVAYARVSPTKQKSDLQNRIQYLKKYIEQNNWNTVALYSDVGSGLNDKRKD